MTNFGYHGKKYRRATRSMKRDENKKSIRQEYIQTSLLSYFLPGIPQIPKDHNILEKRNVVILKKSKDCYNANRQLISEPKKKINIHFAKISKEAYERTFLGILFLDAETMQTTKVLAEFAPNESKCLHVVNKHKDTIMALKDSNYNKNGQLNNPYYGLFDDYLEKCRRCLIKLCSIWFDGTNTWGVRDDRPIETIINKIFKYKLIVDNGYVCITSSFRNNKGHNLDLLKRISKEASEIAQSNGYNINLVKKIVYNNSSNEILHKNGSKLPNSSCMAYLAYRCKLI